MKRRRFLRLVGLAPVAAAVAPLLPRAQQAAAPVAQKAAPAAQPMIDAAKRARDLTTTWSAATSQMYDVADDAAGGVFSKDALVLVQQAVPRYWITSG